MRAVLLFSVVVLLLAGVAQAEEAQMEMPKPAPELSQLKDFDGSWVCDNHMKEMPEFGPAHNFKSTWDSASAVGGFAFTTKWHELPNDKHPEFIMQGIMGYDSTKRNFSSSAWTTWAVTTPGSRHRAGRTAPSRLPVRWSWTENPPRRDGR
ncbi:MAG: hypothetical protein M5R36_13295 [Deltaproteobacteria bacterium]|nr:hypothetical protein [Deltaproteobacteria bacterium]